MDIIRPLQSLEACCGDMPDPRVVGRCDHLLIEIILVAVCAVLYGAESWSEEEESGESKETWLRQYLELPVGIPSHDTFRRVFRLLAALGRSDFHHRACGHVIAVDGETARGQKPATFAR